MLNVELLELQYKYSQKYEGKINIFPPFWFDVENDEAKIKALKKALAENKMLIDVSTEFVEGVNLS